MVEIKSPSVVPLNYQNSQEHPTPTFKVNILGDSSVGKSSIADCFAMDKAVIQRTVRHKQIKMKDNSDVMVELCDAKNGVTWQSVDRSSMTSAVGAFVVFDLTERSTFESLHNWVNLLKE